MSNLLIAFFCLLPFGSFFFRTVDIWHGQGQFIQVGILILFCYSFFEKPKYTQPLNKPLGAFMLWAGLVTSYWWIKVFADTKHYPVKIFMPFFNMLCLVLLYKLIVEYLNKDSIEKILKCLKYSILLILFYCFLQQFKLDEFLSDSGKSKLSELVGIMGNRSHSAGLLAIYQPLFFNKNRENILSLILLWLVILITGSASALVVGIIVILFSLYVKREYIWYHFWFYSALGLSTIALIFIGFRYHNFFTDNGRYEIWKQAFDIFKEKAITGRGIGYYGILKIRLGDALEKWQHLHNEWFQLAIELGIIGLILGIWIVYDYFKTFRKNKTDLTVKLSSIFLGFCLLCFFSFPAHLWVISTLVLFSYAGIYAIKNEELNQCAPV